VRYGEDINDGKRVALKIVDLSRFRDDTVTLMIKEIRIMKMLKHRHCIRILDVKENVPYTGMT
jgi:serine/threonine protein kinase